MERRLAAIFAADVAGYSRLMGDDEEGTLERLQSHRRELIDPKIAEHQGRIVKTTGDGVLVEFASAVKAVRCALEVQHGMLGRNADVPNEHRIEFRIGINLGDVVVEEGDIYGDGVNVAARLENIAEPGAVYVSRAVRDFIRDQPELLLEDLGEQPLKNIAKPVQVFRIGTLARPAGPLQGPPPVPDKPSIAVLPFTNMSGDAEQEYFSDGITEDVITDLSKVSGLFVIARNSSFIYKGRSAKVQDIGRDLGVRFVLEGSIRKSGNRVRITAQLIDATSGGHVWAERFDRELTDIFATQDEVVEKIVRALAVELTHGEEQRLGARRGTTHIEAYEAYLRARQFLSRSTREGMAQAKVLHRRAIEIDPKFAAPHAGLSLAIISEYISDWAPDPAAALDDAELWARRALELNEQLPLSHMALANVLLWRRNLTGALAEARRMIELDPNFAQGHASLGLGLMYAGKSAEALDSFAMTMRLDPHFPSIVLHFLAQAEFSLGQYEAAAQHLRERIARTPGTDSSRMMLAACYGHLGRLDDARTAWAELLKVNPDFSFAQRERVLPYKNPEDFRRIADGLAKAGLP